MPTNRSDNDSNNEIRCKIRKIYLLVIFFTSCAWVQWLLINNFDFLDFLLNIWVFVGLFATFFSLAIIFAIIYKSLTESNFPNFGRWIIWTLAVELIIIAVGPIFKYLDHYVILVALPVVLLVVTVFFMMGLIIGQKPIPFFCPEVVVACNAILAFVLINLAIAYCCKAKYFNTTLYIAVGVCVPILCMNSICFVLLINNWFQPKTITDCVLPAVCFFLIYVLFVALSTLLDDVLR